MAYVIEVDGLRVEGETERDAKRLLRKAQKEKEAAECLRQDRRERARVYAESEGYKVLYRLADRGDMACHWSLYRPGDKYAPFRAGTADSWDGKVRSHTLQMKGGDAVLEHGPGYFHGCVSGMSGQVFIVFFRDPSRPSDAVDAYAVGHYEGEIGMVSLPGIRPEMFDREETAVAS